MRWWNLMFNGRATLISRGKQASELLVLPTFPNSDLYLDVACVVGCDGDGKPVRLDTMNPAHFGMPFRNGPIDLRWSATTASVDLKTLSGFYPFHGGAMISPEIKRLFESLALEGIEYWPLDVRHRSSGALLGEWWFANVFGWRDVFDFDRSDFATEDFRDPPTGFQLLESRFGPRRAVRLRRLQLLSTFQPEGLYLARFPNEKICLRVFLSSDLANAICEVSPNPKAIVFERLSLLSP